VEKWTLKQVQGDEGAGHLWQPELGVTTVRDFHSNKNVEIKGTWHAPRRFCRQSEESVMPRELIDTGTDKRYVRRDEQGQFKESDDVGRSLAQDQKRDSSTKPKKGEGDKGDR
jgi:hypothetical protein